MTNEAHINDPQVLPTPATIHLPDGDYTLSITDPTGAVKTVKVKGPGVAEIAVVPATATQA